MHQVFISYASEDARVANEICARLESGGVQCWIAPRNIAPGSDYATAIVRAIETCSTLLLVYTDKANESPFVLKEVERAVSKRKPVLTVRLTAAEPSPGLELFIASTQWLDAEKEPLEQSLGRLSAVLSKQGAATKAEGGSNGSSAPSHTMSDYYRPPAPQRAPVRIPPAVGYGLAGVAGAGVIGAILWLSGAFGPSVPTGPGTDTPPVVATNDTPPTTSGDPTGDTPGEGDNKGSNDNVGGDNVVVPENVPVTTPDQVAENAIAGVWRGETYDIYGINSTMTLTLHGDGRFNQSNVSATGFELEVWGKWESSDTMLVLNYDGWKPQENCARPAGCSMIQLGNGDDIPYELKGTQLVTDYGTFSRQ